MITVKKEMIKKEMTLLTCSILLLVVVVPTPAEVLNTIIELPSRVVELIGIELPRRVVERIGSCPIWVIEFLTEIPKTWTEAFTRMVEGDYK